MLCQQSHKKLPHLRENICAHDVRRSCGVAICESESHANKYENHMHSKPKYNATHTKTHTHGVYTVYTVAVRQNVMETIEFTVCNYLCTC